MKEQVTYKNIAPHIYSLRFWIQNTNSQFLSDYFGELLKKTNYQVLDFSEHHFPVQGYTAIWLLAESHLAIHTFPNQDWSYIELSGCNEVKTQKFRTHLEQTDLNIRWETTSYNKSCPENVYTD